jgi:hypothetical protein
MSSSGYEATYVREKDPFADLSVESTLIDPKLALSGELRDLADKLAASAHDPTMPPGSVTRVKVRVNQLGSGATQIGEMIPPDMDVLMTAHLPVSLSIEDIAGDEMGDDRYERPVSRDRSMAQRSMARVEVSEALVRPVHDFDEEEPHTVNQFVEPSLPEGSRVARVKSPVRRKATEQQRPARESFPKIAAEPSYDPDPTLPPRRALSRALDRSADGFAVRPIPADEITKTSYGQLRSIERPEQTTLELAHDEELADLPYADDMPAPKAESFDDILSRVRSPRPRHDVAPQRYIPTVITSQPKIGITAEDTSLHTLDELERDPLDSPSGFADGNAAVMDSAAADALTKPPRMVSPYVIVGLGVIGVIAALFHAIAVPA